MDYQLSLQEILDLLGDQVERQGHYEGMVGGIASLEEAKPGDLSFCSGERYLKELKETRASVVLIRKELETEPGNECLYLRVENPSLALAKICNCIAARLWPQPEPGIHPSAVVDPEAEIAGSVTVGPLCVIGRGSRIGPGTHLVSQATVGKEVEIGENCWLAPQVVVNDYCRIGNRCRLHSGAVLGSDGFGYEVNEGNLLKLPQVGIVVLEDDVEIGALCTLDRARFAETRIGSGTKIDNLVQIGHNVRVGKNTAIAAQVGVSGSTRIGNGVLIYGQAGIAGHLVLGDRAVIAAKAGVTKNVKAGQKVRGNPIMEISAYEKLAILQRKLPEFVKRIEKLEEMSETNGGSRQNEAIH